MKRDTSFGVALFVVIGIWANAQSPLQENSEPRHGTLQLTSGLGRKLYALPDNDAVSSARKELAADPQNPDRALKLSKAEASRRQYREAIVTCTQGLVFTPKSADLYLERGHRELGLREFRPAMKDLEMAVNLSPENLEAHYHRGWPTTFLENLTKRQTRLRKPETSRKPATV